MKRVWVAIGLLTIILVSSVFYINQHHKMSDQIVIMLNEISYLTTEQKPEQMPAKIDQLREIWKKEHYHWDVLFGKNLTSPIIEHLNQLDYLYKLEMYDELVLETRKAITHIECIWEYQKVLYTNLV